MRGVKRGKLTKQRFCYPARIMASGTALQAAPLLREEGTKARPAPPARAAAVVAPRPAAGCLGAQFEGCGARAPAGWGVSRAPSAPSGPGASPLSSGLPSVGSVGPLRFLGLWGRTGAVSKGRSPWAGVVPPGRPLAPVSLSLCDLKATKQGTPPARFSQTLENLSCRSIKASA